MSPKFAAALCALLAVLPPSAASAQPEPGKVDLRPAFISEDGIGDVVVYLSDDFRRSAPIRPEPLNLITIQRSNPGDALNSPEDDMKGLHQYMKANEGFRAKDLVAISSSRDLIRIFFRGDHRALAGRFVYPRATWTQAPPEKWARLRSIAIADFSRFLARRASLQAQAERQFLGPRVPSADQRTLELSLGIEAGAGRGGSLASALARRRFGAVAPSVTRGPGGDALELKARFPFSEAAVERIMNAICAEAAKSGAECVSWSARFETIELPL